MRAHILEEWLQELQGVEKDIMGTMPKAEAIASDSTVMILLRLTRALLAMVVELASEASDSPKGEKEA